MIHKFPAFIFFFATLIAGISFAQDDHEFLDEGIKFRDSYSWGESISGTVSYALNAVSEAQREKKLHKDDLSKNFPKALKAMSADNIVEFVCAAEEDQRFNIDQIEEDARQTAAAKCKIACEEQVELFGSNVKNVVQHSHERLDRQLTKLVAAFELFKKEVEKHNEEFTQARKVQEGQLDSVQSLIATQKKLNNDYDGVDFDDQDALLSHTNQNENLDTYNERAQKFSQFIEATAPELESLKQEKVDEIQDEEGEEEGDE